MGERPEFIDARQMSLEEWLYLLFNPPNGADFIDYEFPTDEHRQEYLSSIDQRSEEDVYRLLCRFLIPSGTLGIDELRLAGLEAAQKDAPEIYERMIRSQYHWRLVLYSAGHSQIPPWEGITWVLDLLPHFPRQALEGLKAYILAHAQELPDGRYRGLHDAAVVIRAKFIGMPGTQSETIQYLLDLHPRDFECLTERLYHYMDYETRLTAARKDGGRDIIASRQTPGKLEHLRIECKRYTGPVGVEIVRSLLGVISDKKSTKVYWLPLAVLLDLLRNWRIEIPA